MTYQWDFSVIWRYSPLLVDGAAGTAWLFATSLSLAVPLGLLLAILRLSRIPVVSQLAVGYIDLFRAAPALVLIIWFYYALPVLIRVEFEAGTAATLALGLQAAAYFAEVFRAGILSVSRGQTEAAKSIGLGRGDTLWFVVLPQAVRKILPVLFTRLIELLKSTALAVAITYQDLVYNAGEIAARTFRPIEAFTVAAFIYFVVIWSMSRGTRLIERRLAVADRGGPL